MRIKIYLALLAFVCAVVFCLPQPAQVVSAYAAGKAQTQQIFRCTVKDSTGTPLNVRSSPGGKRIVAKLKNGTRVYVENFSGDSKDQSWAEVKLSSKRNAKPLGWVLQELLECDE